MSEGPSLPLNDEERVAALCERLGLAPGSLLREPTLEALRHGSWLHEQRAGPLRSNERLEFLGDAVLGACVAQLIYDRFPLYSEGELTRLRAAVVKAEALAQTARSLNLGELMLLGRGENRSGGRDKQNLLADALEAVVAAVYLSQGLARATEVVGRLLAPLFEAFAAGEVGRDFKTALQERMQAEHRLTPSYTLVGAPGPDHARTFEVEVVFQGQPLARGTGRTKKEAEQAAARSALEGLLAARKAGAAPAEATPAAAPADPGPSQV